MSSNGTTQQDLDELFPVPSLPPSPLSPQRLPGSNLESLAALRHVLKDNHQRHHIFFNDMGFHNHTTHRALALFALGGSETIIRDYYERDSHIQRPKIQSPEPITEANFIDHLGDERFYQTYIYFFSKQVSEKGCANTLEEFIFSDKYNFQEGRDANTQPEMLSHFLTGLLHPLIHVGHGVEFGLKGMFVEGLAMAAVHRLPVKGCIPASSFASTPANVVELTNRFSSFALDAPPTTNAPILSKTGGVHAFDIVARMLKDARFNPNPTANLTDQYPAMLAECSTPVREHADQWTVDLNQPGEIERKVEELMWLSTLLYAVGGLTTNGLQAEFFLMHLVTSSIFLHSLIAYLSPRSQVLLLRGHLFTVLSWWVLRGRPALNIKSFMTTTSVKPSIAVSPTLKTPLTTETTLIPNPFLPILQSAITHPDEHVIKTQRALAHLDILYGRRPVGYFKGTGLEDAELLDGSLFVRASLSTADYVGWVPDGKEERAFRMEGFYA